MDPKENQHLQHEASEQRKREIEEARRKIEGGEKPWQEEAGVMSVVDAVRDQEFPKKKEDLRNEVGDREVFTSADKKFRLEDVLGRLKGEEEFASIQDFQTAVQKHWGGIEFMETPEEQRPQHGGVQPQQAFDD